MAQGLLKVVETSAPAVEPKAVSESVRAMFMGLPSLAFDCLRQAINGCGIEADTYSFDERLPDCTSDYDVFLMFLVRYEPSTQPVIRRRLNELRQHMSEVPALALIEDADTDAAALRQMGFSTVVAGLPSVRFTVDLVRLMLISIRPAVARSEITAVSNGSGNGRFDADGGAVCFTRRETELLEFLRRGMPNKIIAHQLGISESTVKAHLHNIMAKLHAKNRTQAICLLGRDAARKNSLG